MKHPDSDEIEVLEVADTPTPAAVEDRGDVVQPALDATALSQVAAEPEVPPAPDAVANAVADEPDAATGSPQPANRMVPLARLNEALDRSKALAAQNQQLLDALTRPGQTRTGAAAG